MRESEKEFEDLNNPPLTLSKVPLNKIKKIEVVDAYKDHIMSTLSTPGSDIADKKMKKFDRDARRVLYKKLNS